MKRFGVVAAALALAVVALPARAATPSSGALSSSRPLVSWTGTVPVPNPSFCLPEPDPTCDHFALDVAAGADEVSIFVDGDDGADIDLWVLGPAGEPVASSAGPSSHEEVHIPNAVAGRYDVGVSLFAGLPGATYHGSATFVGQTPPDSGPPVDGVTQDCLEAVPHEASPFLTNSRDDDQQIDLTVAVLADGQSAFDHAQEILNLAAGSYAPLHITLEGSVEQVNFPSDGTTSAGDPRPRQDASTMNALAKEHFGGVRPASADLVFTLTDKNIYEDAEGDAVAGLADCIGGVEFPDRAFAVGENIDGAQEFGPIGLDVNIAAKTMAHELGHLMGAQHHYANCVEGTNTDDVKGDVGPCTVMINDVDLAGFNFSTLNGAVVRGHASDYARP